MTSVQWVYLVLYLIAQWHSTTVPFTLLHTTLTGLVPGTWNPASNVCVLHMHFNAARLKALEGVHKDDEVK